MALFPAYAQDVADIETLEEGRASELSELSPSREIQLLASENDSGTDDELPTGSVRPARSARSARQPSHHEHFYWDTKSDYGNLRVSTLYYPGRPEYALSGKRLCRVGGGGGGGGSGGGKARRRYYQAPVPEQPAHGELATRAAAYRRALHDDTTDHQLWLRYIDFQEQWFDGEAALRVAEEAMSAVKGHGVEGERAVRCELQRLRVAHLPRDTLLGVLRAELQPAGAEEPAVQWARLAAALGAEGTRAPALAAAALPRLAHLPAAYPHLLYIHGATLRAAGLWEQLVLMMELVAAMNFPPAGFPPPHDDTRASSLEHDLLAAEDKAMRSALPLSVVWARVERARAAAHWRPTRDAHHQHHEHHADPQRRPLPADVADLLLPVADDDAAFLLCVNLLRLAKVPLFPQAEYVTRACGVGGLADEEVGGAAGAWGAGDAEALLPLLRAARRLPPAHPAHPAAHGPHAAHALLAHFLDPPHYFTDESGFLSWVSSLWEACCSWTRGPRRVALVCWRLRWLHALVLLCGTEGGDAEKRRLVGEARAVLKRHAGESPLPFAQFARVEAAAGARERAARVAERALRAALDDEHCPVTHRLYIARVVREVCGCDGGCGCGGGCGCRGGGACACAWALPCAVLGRAPPPEPRRAPPGAALLHAALRHCVERCSELEARFTEADEGASSACAAFLPAAGEWAAARVALETPRALLHVARDLPRLARRLTRRRGGEAARYCEQCACALVTSRDRRLAAGLHEYAALFPHNALLAIGGAGSCVWSRRVCAGGAAAGGGSRSHVSALALVVPSLLRAAAADWAPRECESVRACSARASRRGCGGALLCACAVECAARSARPLAARALLLAALRTHPDHKWLYVRGAAWVPSEAETLADVLLERQLRAHALRDELERPLHEPLHEPRDAPQQQH